MKIIDLIVCDDIRNEIGNKHTVVGIYDSLTIHLKKDMENIGLRLGFFMRMLIDENEILPESFEFNCFFKDNTVQSVKGELKTLGKVNIFTIAIKHQSFPIPGPGELSFNLKFFHTGKLIADLVPDYKLAIKFEKE